MEQYDERESVVLQYGEMVYNIALRYVSRREDAEDIYSEAFLRYFRSDWNFESEEHRKAWLIRVTINCATDLLRGRRDGLELNEEIAGEEKTPDYDQYMDLHDAVEHLPLIYKEAITLFYLQDIPIKEIAGILNLNENTVKSRLKTARDMLRAYLEPED